MKFHLDKSTVRARARNAVIGTVLLVAGGLVFAVLASNGLSIPCPFKWFIGLDCPGCGNTRAALSLLKLDFAAAFSYNLLWLPEFLFLGWIYGESVYQYIKNGRFGYSMPFLPMDIAMSVVIVIWGIARNVLFFDAEAFSQSKLMDAWHWLQYMIGVVL